MSADELYEDALAEPANLRDGDILLDGDQDPWTVTAVFPHVMLCYGTSCRHVPGIAECKMPFDAVNERFGPLYSSAREED